MDKVPVNVDPDLLAQAQEAGLDVDHMAERALRLALQKADPTGAEACAVQWARENAEAIADYNRRRQIDVSANGACSATGSGPVVAPPLIVIARLVRATHDHPGC